MAQMPTDSETPTRKPTRRQYLKTTAMAAAVAGGVGAASSPAAAYSDGDIIEVDFSAYNTPSDTYNISKPEYITFDTDRVRTGDRSIEVDIPAGNHRGGNVRYRFDEHGIPAQTELYQQSWIYADIPDDWTDYGENWRIFNAALSDGPRNAAVNGAPTGDDGWSNRMYLTGNYDPDDGYANMVSYTYHMDQPRDHGEHDNIKTSPFPLREWVNFECYVKTNTVTNGSANHDGEVKYWVNGEEVYHRDDFRFTTDRENNIIDYCGPVGYYGGTYEAPINVKSYYDNHKMRLGAGRPAERGEEDGSDGGSNDGSDGGSNDGSDGGSNDGSDGGSNDGSDGGSNDGSDGGSNDGSDGGSNDGSDGGSNDGSDGGSNDDDAFSDEWDDVFASNPWLKQIFQSILGP